MRKRDRPISIWPLIGVDTTMTSRRRELRSESPDGHAYKTGRIQRPPTPFFSEAFSDAQSTGFDESASTYGWLVSIASTSVNGFNIVSRSGTVRRGCL